MYISKLPIKLSVVFGFIALIFLLSTSGASAQVLSHQQLDVDDSIVQPDDSYSVPTKIVVVPLFPPSTSFGANDTDWFRGLYYFMVGNSRRPGFTDIPFHYVVSKDGRVFKGNKGGEERKISVEGIEGDLVLIGYLASRSDNAFDPRSQDVMGELIVDVANRNSIPLDKVSVSAVSYKQDDTAQTISLARKDIFGLWANSLQTIVNTVKHLYKPISKEYSVAVVQVDMPQAQPKPGEEIVGSVTLKNTGDFGMYAGTSSDLVASKTAAGGSMFYLSSFWASTSQFSLLADNLNLLPGEEKKLDFRLFVPLNWGVQTEEFSLGTVGGYKIPESKFNISLDVARPEGIIVQVKETETGWLRVRVSPSGGAEELTRISTGERFFQLEDAGNGWVKLKLNDGREGWASKQYLTYL